MIALLTETLRGNITPQVCNSAVSAGTRALKSVELELRYGKDYKRVFREHMSGVLEVKDTHENPKLTNGSK